jgi:hypothetical protein
MQNDFRIGVKVITLKSVYSIPAGTEGVVLEIIPNYFGDQPGHRIQFEVGATVLGRDEFEIKD